jgi:hypothetical protein
VRTGHRQRVAHRVIQRARGDRPGLQQCGIEPEVADLDRETLDYQVEGSLCGGVHRVAGQSKPADDA